MFLYLAKVAELAKRLTGQLERELMAHQCTKGSVARCVGIGCYAKVIAVIFGQPKSGRQWTWFGFASQRPADSPEILPSKS